MLLAPDPFQILLLQAARTMNPIRLPRNARRKGASSPSSSGIGRIVATRSMFAFTRLNWIVDSAAAALAAFSAAWFVCVLSV